MKISIDPLNKELIVELNRFEVTAKNYIEKPNARTLNRVEESKNELLPYIKQFFIRAEKNSSYKKLKEIRSTLYQFLDNSFVVRVFKEGLASSLQLEVNKVLKQFRNLLYVKDHQFEFGGKNIDKKRFKLLSDEFNLINVYSEKLRFWKNKIGLDMATVLPNDVDFVYATPENSITIYPKNSNEILLFNKARINEYIEADRYGKRITLEQIKAFINKNTKDHPQPEKVIEAELKRIENDIEINVNKLFYGNSTLNYISQTRMLYENKLKEGHKKGKYYPSFETEEQFSERNTFKYAYDNYLNQNKKSDLSLEALTMEELIDKEKAIAYVEAIPYLEELLEKYKFKIKFENTIDLPTEKNNDRQLNENQPDSKETNKEIKLPEGYTRIKGYLSDEEINTFFSFLYKEKNGDKKPFLSESDTKELLRHGFSIPDEPTGEYFKLDITAKKPKIIIQYCFYRLYEEHYTNASIKADIVKFLVFNFEDFKNDNIVILSSNMRDKKPAKIKFSIEKYLP